MCCQRLLFFFFSSRRRHTRYWRDWSSDVCSSDLVSPPQRALGDVPHRKFPVPRGLVQPVEKPLALLLFRDVEQEFQDHRAVAREEALNRRNALEPLAPDI